MVDEQQSTAWEHFWKTSPSGFNEVMMRSTEYFADQLQTRYPAQADDRLLDIGCGPGFLIDALKLDYQAIHGTDISGQYIGLCNARFEAYPHITFSETRPYDFSAYDILIREGNISRVVMLSVLQYYRTTKEVRALLEALKATSKHRPFVCILADIMPEKHSFVSDIRSIVTHAYQKRYLGKFSKFLWYALSSNYRQIKRAGMLHIDHTFFEQAAAELQISLQIVKGLSIHSGRYSVLLDFTK